MNNPDTVRGLGYIDDVSWHAVPAQAQRVLLVSREYFRVAERLSLEHGAAWVTLRKAMQGVE